MPDSRRGFSLMEVLLATSILLASSIALIELATIGRKQANTAYDLNQAQLLCQAKLDEIATGITPMTAVESQEFEDGSGWFYSVETLPLRFGDLTAVSVSVFQEEKSIGRPVRFSLVRWMPGDSKTDSSPPSAEMQTPERSSPLSPRNSPPGENLNRRNSRQSRTEVTP